MKASDRFLNPSRVFLAGGLLALVALGLVLLLAIGRISNPADYFIRPQATSTCVQACVQSQSYNGNYSFCNTCCSNGTCSQFGGGGGGTGGSCYNDCYAKTGNGSGCTYVCNNNPSCWTGCSAQGKACLTSCLKGGGQTHLECKVGGGGTGVKKLNDDAPALKYDGPWGYVKGGGGTSIMYNEDYHYAPAPLSNATAIKNLGAAMSFTFTGTKVGVRFIEGGNRGYADIYIDEEKVDSYDAHTSGAILGRPPWESETLSCGQHTIKVTQSDKDVANHGKVVVIDYVEYAQCGSGAEGGSCVKVAGVGGNMDGCTSEGASCQADEGSPEPTPTPTPGDQIGKCWGNGGGNGKCYDCNGDAAVNILDFTCFARHWMEDVE